ncbi:beta-propeller domain-containing protein [Ornithinibacillus xuwenensis]|uniref:Beta-propeller domain-containing protein n=1 Tax=Ornithinibacillus xuwenensis TaxID=3144668 RepID=A0ABU9XHD3_9BACI
MKKKIGLISIGVISIVILMIFLFTNRITAEIPSASSFVPTYKDWTVHFSEPMNPDTFTEENVLVQNKSGEPIAVTLEWNEANTILTLRAPERGYSIDETYQIVISNNVETASGRNLSKKFSHNFTAVGELPSIKDQKQLITLLEERMEAQQKNEFVTFESDTGSAEAKESADTAVADESSSGDGSSNTNVQVDGVDEADIIKTNGESIFFVRDGDIIITSTDEENSEVLSQIKLENYYPNEIYLHDKLLITIGNKSEPLRKVKESDKEPGETVDSEIGIYEPMYSSQTTVYIYDVQNPEEPKQIREVSHEGYYNTSRILDGYLYLIANEHPPFHILEQEDVEVRPFIKDTAISEASKPVDFNDMYFFPESDEEQFLILASIDLEDMEKEANIETYLGASEQIYMSQENLYVAVNKYTDTESSKSTSSDKAEIMIWRPENVDTEITQFQIDNGSLTYNASTVVNGTLINQFAMDERDNTFRVATTKENWEDDEQASTNNLYTFDQNLQPLGSVEGLAEGERIYSVRFMKDVAYMVTFKQVDPLFVIDLKDPANPTVLGELKIPGFSNYLHPLDENHVIGFGQHTKLIEEEGMNEPRVQTAGVKISVFDVSDPTNPTEKYSEVIGQGGSYSEILHNHKALYQHPTENLFGFPAVLSETKLINKGDISYEEYNPIFEGAILYKITAEDGIQLYDTVTHQAEFDEYPEWTSEIKRMVSVDDTLYTFSWNQMKVYDISSQQVVKSVDLPELHINY